MQYERLPFFCFACGIIGQSELECPTPVERDEEGKLPYGAQLRAPEEHRRKMPSFAGAAVVSFGSGSTSSARPQQSDQSTSGGARSSRDKESSHHSASVVGDSDEQEVQSPLKRQDRSVSPGKRIAGSGASRQLDLAGGDNQRTLPWKRKPKQAQATQTLDLNIPLGDSHAIVPAELVTSMVN